MVIDAITFNGEYDLLDLRLNVLDNLVDKFIIVEAKTTFSGNPKPLYFAEKRARYKQWQKRINYHVINEDYTKEEWELARNSINTQGAAHWKNEFLQKESIKKALFGLDEYDVCYIGDCDEIWEPYLVPLQVSKLKLKVYSYKLNNRSNEEFWGTISGLYKHIRRGCLNHLRSTDAIRTTGYHGWHFTNMGGEDMVRRKLNDSYTRESYNTNEVQNLLSNRMVGNSDYLGRKFTFTVDESDWPQYLKDNKEQWKHLIHS